MQSVKWAHILLSHSNVLSAVLVGVHLTGTMPAATSGTSSQSRCGFLSAVRERGCASETLDTCPQTLLVEGADMPINYAEDNRSAHTALRTWLVFVVCQSTAYPRETLLCAQGQYPGMLALCFRQRSTTVRQEEE